VRDGRVRLYTMGWSQRYPLISDADEKVLVRAQKERPFTAGSLKFSWAFSIKRALRCGQQTTSVSQTCPREWFYLDVLPF